MRYLITLVVFLSFKLLVGAQPPTETVGSLTNSTPVNEYDGWTNQGVLAFSGNAEVQSTNPSNYRGASGGGNVFFTNKPDTYFEISNFPRENVDTIDYVGIVFGIYSSDKANFNDLLIEVSKDSSNFFPIIDTSNSIYPAATWTTRFVSFNGHFNPKDLRLRFRQTSSTTQFTIDDIHFSYVILLSIKLKQFTSLVNGNSAQLLWTASSNSSEETFIVEKSINGTDFNLVERQYAKGTGTFNYSFTDHSPLNIKTFYRLKMQNEDGTYSYSNVLRVMPIVASKNILLNVYPLPAKDKLNIQLQNKTAEKAAVSVTDIFGKTLIKNTWALAAGGSTHSINIKSLSNGVYFLKVTASQATETRKIIIGQ